MSAETQVIIERHEVDGRTERSFVCTCSTKVTTQICDVVTLVPKDIAHPPRRFSDEFGYLHARMHSQSNGQSICQHARRASREGRHPSGNRHIEDHVHCGCQPVHENRRCRRYQLS